MKFKFPLEKVLKHRQINMDLARKDYLDAVAFLDEEKNILQGMIKSKDDALNERAHLVATTTNWQLRVNELNLYVTGQDLRIAQQNERLFKIEKVVESRREILKEALTEVKIMERLKEKQKADFVQEAQNNEQKELDEISTIRFVRMTKDS